MNNGIMQIDPKSFSRIFSIKKTSERYKAMARTDAKSIIDSVKSSNDPNRSFFSIVGSVGVIPVVGMLMPVRSWVLDWYEIEHTSYAEIIEAVKSLEANPMVSSIEFYFNTPGGYVDGSDETCETILACSKPTVGRVGMMAASAGYKLLCCCGNVVANTNGSMVGSVGTVIEAVDWSGWEEAVGIKTVNITNRTSEEKRPNIATEEGKNVIRDELDDIQSVFEEYIIRGRESKANFSIESVRGLKGRMITAKKALAIGMIDSIGKGTVVESTNKSAVTENKSVSNIKVENSHGGTMDLKTMCAESPELQAQLDSMINERTAQASATMIAEKVDQAVNSERARCVELLTKGGAQLSATLTTAISGGSSLADFAISMLNVHGGAPTSVVAPVVATNNAKDADAVSGGEDPLDKAFSKVDNKLK